MIGAVITDRDLRRVLHMWQDRFREELREDRARKRVIDARIADTEGILGAVQLVLDMPDGCLRNAFQERGWRIPESAA